jgi:hypothetical protein
MIDYSMSRYLNLRSTDTLGNDLVWRNHDFSDPIAARPVTYRKAALKALGLGYAGELGVGQFAALWDVPLKDAEYVLVSWWCWSRVGLGVPIRGAKRRAVEPLSVPACPT